MTTKLSYRSILAVCALAVSATAASAQQVSRPQPATNVVLADQNNVPAAAQNAQDAVERTVKRWGIGFFGGVGLDPELIEFGAHATFGPIFTRNIQFRPGVEFGFGELTTAFGINLDGIYTLPGTRSGWSPYVGVGPQLGLSHTGFTTPTTGSGSRFNFSDTNFEGGVNFIAGARSDGGGFFELKATAYGVSNVSLRAGFTF